MAVTAAVLAVKPAEPMEVPADVVLVIAVIRPRRLDGSIIGTMANAPSESEVSLPWKFVCSTKGVMLRSS